MMFSLLDALRGMRPCEYQKKVKTYSSLSEALEELSKLKAAFPNVVKILQISLTIVITTASWKR